jgi:hypothetical protein
VDVAISSCQKRSEFITSIIDQSKRCARLQQTPKLAEVVPRDASIYKQLD